MASFTLRPAARWEFDALLGGLQSNFPGEHVEAAHNDIWGSYRLDVSCDAPWEGDLIAWLQGQHGDCPRT